MRTIAIQADGGPDGNDAVMEAALLFIVTHIPVGLKGFKFDGDLHNGTIVNHRHQGEWVVSFRPTGRDAATRRRTYTSPHAVVRAIIERRHVPDVSAAGQRYLIPLRGGVVRCAKCSRRLLWTFRRAI